MQSQPPPVYIIAPGRVYRRETPDATHLPVFHQVEGLAVDEGITFADLKGTLEAVAKELFGERAARAPRPGVLPVRRARRARSGCRASSATASGAASAATAGSSCSAPGWCIRRCWRTAGTTRERYTGFAFGIGIDRVALLRYAIPDIRMLVDGDVRFLAQFGASS